MSDAREPGTTRPGTARAVRQGLLASAALIAAVTVASRVVGFGRWVAFSHGVGAGCVGDTYATANQLPNVLFEVAAGGAMAGAVVPLLAAPLAQGRREDVDRIASALLGWAVAVLLPLSVLLAVLAGPLTGLLVPHEDCSGQRALAATMLLVFAPQVLLYGIGAVLTGVLQADRRFLWPALAPLLSSVVVVVAYLAYGASLSAAQDRVLLTDAGALPGTALAWLAGGTTLGVVVMTLPLLVPVRRSGVRLRPTLTFPDGVGRRALALAGAGVVALLAQQVFVLATLRLANGSGRPGTLNVFQYSQAVYLLPYAVLAVPLATAAFPRLAAAAGSGDLAGFATLAGRTTRAVLVVGCVGAALLAGTAPAVAAFFGATDRVGVVGMDGALVALAPGLVGFALLAHVSRALYALDRGRAAAVATSAGWLVAAAAAALLVARGDATGTVVRLGAGLCVGMTVGGAALLVALRRAAGRAALAGLLRTGVVGLAGAALAAWSGRGVARGFLDLLGRGLLPSALSGVLAAAVVVLVLGAVVLVGDRGSVRGLRPAALGAGGRGSTGSLRVLLVVGTTGGGTGRHVSTLADGLVGTGASVTVAGPAQALAQFGFAAAGASLVPVDLADRPRPWADLVTTWRLRRAARGQDVVHAHGLRAGALTVLATTGTAVPVVVTLHNALVGDGRIAVVHRILERIVARGADVVLGVSGDLVDRMRDLGARQTGRALVPAPVRPPSSPDGALLRERVRRELAVPEPTALLVTAARLAPQKGLDLLLDAAALLGAPADGGRAVLVTIAGDGPLQSALQRRVEAERLPVRLLGRRDDVPDLLAAADVVVVPSVWEGQPLVVQEALRAGAALVATRVGGTAEVTGDAAVLVPRIGDGDADARAFAAAVRGVLDDPAVAADLQRRAVDRAQELPTDADAVRQVLQTYAAVVPAWSARAVDGAAATP